MDHLEQYVVKVLVGAAALAALCIVCALIAVGSFSALGVIQ